MKVVLLETVKNIGQKGDIKEVKDGYAVNCLIPQGKARPATDENIKKMELNKRKLEEEKEKERKRNLREASKIKNQKIIVKVKTEGKKLFGSLSESEIKGYLAEKGISLQNGKLVLEKRGIKEVGEYQVVVQWPDKMEEKFTLIVESLN